MRHQLAQQLGSERGAVSISTVLGLAALAAFLYAVFGASAGDPDRYGRIPIPSSAVIELPTEESDISYVQASRPEDPVAPPPSDINITVRHPETRELVTVNSKSEAAGEEPGETVTPIARVDPPGAGPYEVSVTSPLSASRPAPQLAFGQSPVGAVGERISRIGELITGPFGIAAGALLLGALVTPRFQRAWRRSRQ